MGHLSVQLLYILRVMQGGRDFWASTELDFKLLHSKSGAWTSVTVDDVVLKDDAA